MPHAPQPVAAGNRAFRAAWRGHGPVRGSTRHGGRPDEEET
jgi:hypothetical protein